jgi:hypothetical protein
VEVDVAQDTALALALELVEEMELYWLDGVESTVSEDFGDDEEDDVVTGVEIDA